jgi:hypothetical protein
MIVVSDKHYESSIQKLILAKFHKTLPARGPPPEIAETVPDMKELLEDLEAGYRNLDQSTTCFNYPVHYNSETQLILIPSSYVHLSVSTVTPTASARTSTTHEYDAYGNLFYPLERTLLESFIRVILKDGDGTTISIWEESLRAWIAQMRGYLEVNNDAVDECPDKEVVEWFSHHFGRKHELKFGPWDLRVSKRLGSGREMPVNMRGQPIGDEHRLDKV